MKSNAATLALALAVLLLPHTDAVGFGDLATIAETEDASREYGGGVATTAPTLLYADSATTAAGASGNAGERVAASEPDAPVVETAYPSNEVLASVHVASTPDDENESTAVPLTHVPSPTLMASENDADEDDDNGADVEGRSTPVPTQQPTPTPATHAPSPSTIGEDKTNDDEEENDNTAASRPLWPTVMPTPTPVAPKPLPAAVKSGEENYEEEVAVDWDDGYNEAPAHVVPADIPEDLSRSANKQGWQPWQQNAQQRPANPDTEPNVNNGGVNLYPYTADIRDYIVEQHNFARATMAPLEAANMRRLEWHESLAIEAAELVNTCAFSHDTENYAYGQNLMYGNGVIDRSTVESWMEAWVVNEISPSDRAGNGFMDLDHASAVLWAKSYYVGCASKMCPNGYLTACNYHTPGNWQGEQAFVPGPPCSQCPPQAPYCDAQYGKLCTASPSGKPTPRPAPKPAPASKPIPATTSPSAKQVSPAGAATANTVPGSKPVAGSTEPGSKTASANPEPGSNSTSANAVPGSNSTSANSAPGLNSTSVNAVSGSNSTSGKNDTATDTVAGPGSASKSTPSATDKVQQNAGHSSACGAWSVVAIIVSVFVLCV